MNIKPGMLCLVIGGRNPGRECTVIRWVKKGDDLPRDFESSINAWLIHGPNIHMGNMNNSDCWVDGYGLATSLMPLANGEDDVIVKSEVDDYVARQTNKDALLPERA